jgi:hypothetical protein
MISRSQVATPARIRQHQLRCRVAGVQALAAHAQDDQADTTLRQVGFDGQQLRRAACLAVRLRDRQDIAVAQEGHALGQFGALGHTGHLFGEQPRRTRGGEVVVPGEPEARTRNWVPLQADTWAAILETGASLGLAPPA